MAQVMTQNIGMKIAMEAGTRSLCCINHPYFIERSVRTPPPSPEMLARMVTAAPKYGVVFA
jgi:hypothetical protein